MTEFKVGDRVEVQAPQRGGGEWDGERGEVTLVYQHHCYVKLDNVRATKGLMKVALIRLNAIERLAEVSHD
jgi:hypothetical protein